MLKRVHADSAFEEAHVKGRTGYFMIAVLLTIPSAAVTVYSGVAIWKAWREDIWGRGILVFLAVLGGTAVANVWVQAVLGSNGSRCGRTIERGQRATPIPAETRGSGNV
jgi:hypothetical protein